LVWRTGVILKLDEARAEIIENPAEKNISIRVSGKNRRDLLVLITRTFDKIHSSFPRLKFAKLIPCNCNVCKNKIEKHFYQFDLLLRFIADGQKIQCPNSYQLVDPDRLIEKFGFEPSSLDDEQEIKPDITKKPDLVIYNNPVTNIGSIIKDVSAHDIEIEDVAVDSATESTENETDNTPAIKKPQKENKNNSLNEDEDSNTVSKEAEEIFNSLQEIWNKRNKKR
jgi:hypothetical protein